MVVYPILGALSLAGGTILEKIILKSKKIDIKTYQIWGFLAITLALTPLLYFFWKLDSQAFSLINLFYLFLVIAFSITANLFVFYSIKHEKISKIEPARVLEPLFVIMLALVFSAFFGTEIYERNLKIIIPGIIAGLALIIPNIKKHHLKFNKYFTAAIFGSFFFALELVISRLILDFYSPITFYFFRCAGVFLLSLIIFKPKKLSKFSGKIKKQIVAVGLIWIIYRVSVYYGYIYLGVVSTTLVIMLGPLFVYIFAHFFLKEKMNWKNIIACFVIVGCVIYASFA